MIKLAIAAVLLGVAAAVAHIHASMQRYHPVVTVAAPENVRYIAVLDARADRPACSAASLEFLEPLRAQCPDCKVVSARCERELQGQEELVHLGRATPHYVVAMTGVRIAIAADADKARATCTTMADEVVRSGVPSAACVYPQERRF